MRGSSRERPAALYLCSSSRLSCRAVRGSGRHRSPAILSSLPAAASSCYGAYAFRPAASGGRTRALHPGRTGRQDVCQQLCVYMCQPQLTQQRTLSVYSHQTGAIFSYLVDRQKINNTYSPFYIPGSSSPLLSLLLYTTG
ncbi:hypothetical protein GDO81_010464 [Engystomops pustulosus]|uniref:Uncharacterized protein n=1 Tax=Engystomops pustulosus TaxID=76066 RepID=A0AAV7C068_ENGPU|nr:hypothetical protein GDO81_010464 [Engystomops pustulosus]